MSDTTYAAAYNFLMQLLKPYKINPNTQEGLNDTPQRMADAWDFWTSGYKKSPLDVITAFKEPALDYEGEMVLQTGIRFYSHCEHHLTPFFGIVHVAYIPDKTVVGLSKISRIVDIYARRLQTQERLSCDIAEGFQAGVSPSVAVIIQARHLCMESRGIQKPGTITTTFAFRGDFRQGPKRVEFLAMTKRYEWNGL